MSLRTLWPAVAIVVAGVADHAGVAAAQPTPAATSTLNAVTAAPRQAGDRYFFTTDSGTLYVRDGRDGPARELLPAKSYGMYAPSRNGRYVAYTIPTSTANPMQGTSYQIRIRDVDTRRDLSDVLNFASISDAPWTDNHKGFFYAREDTSEHRQRVYYHRVGEDQSRDEIIYSRQDAPEFRYSVRVSDDGHYAVFTITHPIDDHTRLYFIDLDNPGKPSLNAPVVKLVDEFDTKYDFIDNGGNSFFLQTTREAPHGRVLVANTDITRESRWPTVLREVADSLQYVKTAGDTYLAAAYRNGDKWIVRLYSPPDPKQMREEMKKRQDSIRKAGHDSTGERRGPPGGMGRGGPGAGGRRGGPMDLFGFRLDLRREIPIPAGATLVGMNSLADQDVLFYTLKLADGSVRQFSYNVKTGANEPFNTSPSTKQ